MSDGSDPMSVSVTGARALSSALKAAGVETDDLKAANMAAGAVVLAASSPPRRTGRLASSGRVARARGRARITYTARYSRPIHWGWPARHIAPQPFAVTAANETQPTWLSVYLDAIAAIVDRVEAAT